MGGNGMDGRDGEGDWHSAPPGFDLSAIDRPFIHAILVFF